jgi:hypothetical protein
MITSIFKKSTPINYSLIGILTIILYFVYQFHSPTGINSWNEIAKKAGALVLIFASLLLANFIVKKNALTRDSSYTALYYLLFLLFFPKIMSSMNLLLANFFVLLSMRRLISLQTLKFTKEKIFDASLWIFVASLFHYWALIFILLVYISIIFNASRDYRNWLIPFVALLGFAVVFLFYDLLFDKSVVTNFLQSNAVSYKIDYFTSQSQNIAFSIFAVFLVFFVFPFIFSIPNKPLNLQASYKKVFFAVLISVVIFLISANKSNEILVFSFLPMAIIATNTVEYFQSKFQQELILLISISCGFFCFFSQL